jgi:hypothetical protein
LIPLMICFPSMPACKFRIVNMIIFYFKICYQRPGFKSGAMRI